MKEVAKCDLCNSELRFVEKKTISGTTYDMMVCEHCKKQVAKRVE